MDKTKFAKLISNVKTGMSKHAPEILTGIGIAGMISTTIMAVKATPKAMRLIEDAERVKYEETGKEPLTAMETVKAAWKPYIPAVVTGAVSVGCLIGGTSIHAKRNAALATAYQLSTTALKEYKAKVVETIGERKERVVHDKIAEEKAKEISASHPEVIFTGNGKTRCIDLHSGRQFESDRNKIERAVNKLNADMIGGSEMYVSLNDFYDEIGLPRIPAGDSVGWRIDRGRIEIYFGAVLLDEDTPCMTIEFLVPPEYGFDKLY